MCVCFYLSHFLSLCIVLIRPNSIIVIIRYCLNFYCCCLEVKRLKKIFIHIYREEEEASTSKIALEGTSERMCCTLAWKEFREGLDPL